jgi:hypothetical protein
MKASSMIATTIAKTNVEQTNKNTNSTNGPK